VSFQPLHFCPTSDSLSTFLTFDRDIHSFIWAWNHKHLSASRCYAYDESSRALSSCPWSCILRPSLLGVFLPSAVTGPWQAGSDSCLCFPPAWSSYAGSKRDESVLVPPSFKRLNAGNDRNCLATFLLSLDQVSGGCFLFLNLFFRSFLVRPQSNFFYRTLYLSPSFSSVPKVMQMTDGAFNLVRSR